MGCYAPRRPCKVRAPGSHLLAVVGAAEGAGDAEGGVVGRRGPGSGIGVAADIESEEAGRRASASSGLLAPPWTGDSAACTRSGQEQEGGPNNIRLLGTSHQKAGDGLAQ